MVDQIVPEMTKKRPRATPTTAQVDRLRSVVEISHVCGADGSLLNF